jgi:arylsulfatase A-like enzyme
MVAAVDDSVGRILAKLDEWQLSNNTVVIFFSDNGGLCTRPETYKKKGQGPLAPAVIYRCAQGKAGCMKAEFVRPLSFAFQAKVRA